MKATEQTCVLNIKLSVVIFKLKWTLWQFFFFWIYKYSFKSYWILATSSFSYTRIKALWTVSFAWDLGILRLTWEIHIFYEKIIFFVWWKFIFAGHYCTSFCKFHYDGLEQAVFIKKWLIFWSKQLNWAIFDTGLSAYYFRTYGFVYTSKHMNIFAKFYLNLMKSQTQHFAIFHIFLFLAWK